MNSVLIRELQAADESNFISAMERSKTLHHPWVKAPLTKHEFAEYLKRSQQPTHKSFLVLDQLHHMVGVFNINEMVRGGFQSGYLGFYAVSDYVGKGYMSAGLKLILKKAFNQLGLHRLEANIQPENSSSIQLVSRNGFRKEGYSLRYLNINGEWRDHERWAITVEDCISVPSA